MENRRWKIRKVDHSVRFKSIWILQRSTKRIGNEHRSNTKTKAKKAMFLNKSKFVQISEKSTLNALVHGVKTRPL